MATVHSKVFPSCYFSVQSVLEMCVINIVSYQYKILCIDYCIELCVCVKQKKRYLKDLDLPGNHSIRILLVTN